MVEHDFWGGNSFAFGVFGSRRGLQLSTEPSEKVQYPHNQAIQNELNEANAYLNKGSSMFKIKFCVFQEQRLNSVRIGFEFLTPNQQKYPSLRAC